MTNRTTDAIRELRKVLICGCSRPTELADITSRPYHNLRANERAAWQLKAVLDYCNVEYRLLQAFCTRLRYPPKLPSYDNLSGSIVRYALFGTDVTYGATSTIDVNPLTKKQFEFTSKLPGTSARARSYLPEPFPRSRHKHADTALKHTVLTSRVHACDQKDTPGSSTAKCPSHRSARRWLSAIVALRSLVLT